LFFLSTELVNHPTNVGDSSVGQREIGVELDRLLEHLESEVQVLPARVISTAQVAVVGLGVFRRLARDYLFLLGRKGDAEGLGDVPCYFILDFEDILHLAVIALCPKGEIGVSVHELRIDAKTVPRPPQASPKHICGIELPANLCGRYRFVSKRQHDGSGKYAQAPYLRQFRDHILSHSVAEIFILLSSTQVFKIEHSH
jgi:hypothetical protein